LKEEFKGLLLAFDNLLFKDGVLMVEARGFWFAASLFVRAG
jgi:hypothetical protein